MIRGSSLRYKRVDARMHDGRREIIRVNPSEIALCRLPPIAIGGESKAPMPPRDDRQIDVQAAGTVTVSLVVLWHRSPESSRTQRRTCMEDGIARRKMAT